jgi:hypothetical protein
VRLVSVLTCSWIYPYLSLKLSTLTGEQSFKVLGK